MFSITPSLGLRLVIILLIGLLLVAGGGISAIEEVLERIHQQIAQVGQ